MAGKYSHVEIQKIIQTITPILCSNRLSSTSVSTTFDFMSLSSKVRNSFPLGLCLDWMSLVGRSLKSEPTLKDVPKHFRLEDKSLLELFILSHFKNWSTIFPCFFLKKNLAFPSLWYENNELEKNLVFPTLFPSETFLGHLVNLFWYDLGLSLHWSLIDIHHSTKQKMEKLK